MQLMSGQMGSISGIDDTIHDTMNRVTGLSPLGHVRQTSREDANLLLSMEEIAGDGVYLYDMGELDDTERSHLIVDKDTQMVYDVRKDIDMARLER